MIFVK